MPDITLLVPLAEVLGVTVTELLECKRMEKSDSMDAGRTDEIVKMVITLSEEEQNLSHMNRKKRMMLFIPIVVLACVETLLLQLWVQLKNIPADNLYLFVLIGTLCGCYFWIFAKEKIPAYYDQNKVTALNNHFIVVSSVQLNFYYKFIISNRHYKFSKTPKGHSLI